MKKDEYKCAVCKKIFKKGWSEEEAIEELKQNFGDFSKEECDIVCDDCYNEMNKKLPFEIFNLINKINEE